MAHLGKGLIAAALIAAAASAPAQADAVSDFYTGKRVNFIIASGAGGGYDSYGRMLARHWGNHIPGKPSIISRNMPGAAGLQMTNYMYNKGKRDGSEVGITYNTLVIEPLIGNPGAKFDSLKLSWLGSMGKQQNICVTWHTSPIKTLDQARAKKDMVVSATGATGNSATMPRIFNALLGTHFKVIQGYSTTGQRLALERGEVEGICGLSYSTLLASNPDWIIKKQLNILAQVGLQKHPDMPDVPMALDMIADPTKRSVLEMLLIPQEMGRPILAPPGLPADRLAALRTAFDATMKDPKFLSEAKRAKLLIEPLTGAEMDSLLKKAASYPGEIVTEAAKMVGKPPKGVFVSCSKYTQLAKRCSSPKKKKKKS